MSMPSFISHSLPFESRPPTSSPPYRFTTQGDGNPWSAERMSDLALEQERQQRVLASKRLEALVPATIAKELTASPYALRAGLLGLARGCAMSFHERRVRLPIAPVHRPDVTFWQHGEALTVWQEGVLQEPKYYSFFIDGPVFAYNPNYRGKWRSHEFLHGAVGFFWRADMTRFDAYLAARQAELLPVVHWYGLDEILRPRCLEHAPLLDPPLRECPRCESMASGWSDDVFSGGVEQLRARAPHHYEAALDHFELEWGACMREWQTRELTPALYKNLNASSDALGYVRAHWPRMTRGESFGRWIEAFMRPGRDYSSDMEGYMARVLDVGARLCGGTIDLDVRSALEAQQRAALQDLGYRALYLLDLETRSSRRERLLAMLSPGVEILSAQVLADTLDPAKVEQGLRALMAGLEEARGVLREGGLVDDVLATGHDLLAVKAKGQARELQQVIEGIEMASPTLHYALKGAEIEPAAFYDGVLGSEAFTRRGPLLGRLAIFLEERGDADFAEVARLEEMLLSWPRQDEVAATLGLEPEAVEVLDVGRIRLQASVRHGLFRAGILEAVLEEDFEEIDFGEDAERVCRIVRRIDPARGLVIEECDMESWKIIEALAAADRGDRVPEGVSDWNQASLRQLLESGVCVCLDV